MLRHRFAFGNATVLSLLALLGVAGAPATLLCGCSTPGAPNPTESGQAPVASTTAAVIAPPGTTPPGLAATPPPSTSAAPAVASAPAAGSAPTPAADAAPTGTAAAEAPPAEPIPNVKVVNIGMHVGGGKNDAAEKEPIKLSVEPHFDSFKRCFARVEDPKKGGDFGLDLRIDKAGGKAKVSHPRTALKGKEFEACVVAVFEGIDFRKPKGGTTVVSYSLRFTPGGA